MPSVISPGSAPEVHFAADQRGCRRRGRQVRRQIKAAGVPAGQPSGTPAGANSPGYLAGTWLTGRTPATTVAVGLLSPHRHSPSWSRRAGRNRLVHQGRETPAEGTPRRSAVPGDQPAAGPLAYKHHAAPGILTRGKVNAGAAVRFLTPDPAHPGRCDRPLTVLLSERSDTGQTPARHPVRSSRPPACRTAPRLALPLMRTSYGLLSAGHVPGVRAVPHLQKSGFTAPH
jgi:hypothetical protein